MRVLPDGCMDLYVVGDGHPMVAGPDTVAILTRPVIRTVEGLAIPAGRASSATGRARARTAGRAECGSTTCSGPPRTARRWSGSQPNWPTRNARARPRRGRWRTSPRSPAASPRVRRWPTSRRHRIVEPHAAAPVQGRLRIRPGDAAAHPPVPPRRRADALGPPTGRRRRRRGLLGPTAPASRGQGVLRPVAGDPRRRSAGQGREQVDGRAVRILDRRVALTPRRVERRQRPLVARGHHAVEQRVDTPRASRRRTRSPRGQATSAASSRDASMRSSPRCRTSTCFRRAARPRRAARRHRGPRARGVGRTQSIDQGCGSRFRSLRSQGECP